MDQGKVEQTAQFVNPLFQAPVEFPASDLGLAFALVNNAQVIVGHYVFRGKSRRSTEKSQSG
jgi:hypothetical protein